MPEAAGPFHHIKELDRLTASRRPTVQMLLRQCLTP